MSPGDEVFLLEKGKIPTNGVFGCVGEFGEGVNVHLFLLADEGGDLFPPFFDYSSLGHVCSMEEVDIRVNGKWAENGYKPNK